MGIPCSKNMHEIGILNNSSISWYIVLTLYICSLWNEENILSWGIKRFQAVYIFVHMWVQNFSFCKGDWISCWRFIIECSSLTIQLHFAFNKMAIDVCILRLRCAIKQWLLKYCGATSIVTLFSAPLHFNFFMLTCNKR